MIILTNMIASESNSINDESISNFDRSRFYEERDSSYYLLIESEILENIIDLIGKYPAKRFWQSKLLATMISRVTKVCHVNLNSLAQTVAGQMYVLPAKKYQKHQLVKTFLINMHVITALRENGKGYAGLESVFGYINLIPPMNVDAFNFHEKKGMTLVIHQFT